MFLECDSRAASHKLHLQKKTQGTFYPDISDIKISNHDPEVTLNKQFKPTYITFFLFYRRDMVGLIFGSQRTGQRARRGNVKVCLPVKIIKAIFTLKCIMLGKIYKR